MEINQANPKKNWKHANFIYKYIYFYDKLLQI